MEHDTPGFARILKEYESVSWDFRATIRLFSRSEGTLKGDFHFPLQFLLFCSEVLAVH